MTALHAVGPAGYRGPPHARLRELEDEYVVELDVAGFTERELEVELLGTVVTVRADQLAPSEDAAPALRLHERLEEEFRLPDDADAAHVRASYAHGVLEVHAPRTPLEPRPVPIEREPWRPDPDAEPC